MSKILVETAEHVADVSIPEGADARTIASLEPAFQKLTNRSAYAKAALDNLAMVGLYSISGTGVADTDPFTLAELYEQGGFSLSANELSVPANGVYQLSWSGRAYSTNATNPSSMPIALYAAGSYSGEYASAIRFSTDNSSAGIASFSYSTITNITNYLTQTFSIRAKGGIYALSVASPSRLIIKRVGEL